MVAKKKKAPPKKVEIQLKPAEETLEEEAGEMPPAPSYNFEDMIE